MSETITVIIDVDASGVKKTTEATVRSLDSIRAQVEALEKQAREIKGSASGKISKSLGQFTAEYEKNLAALKAMSKLGAVNSESIAALKRETGLYFNNIEARIKKLLNSTEGDTGKSRQSPIENFLSNFSKNSTAKLKDRVEELSKILRVDNLRRKMADTIKAFENFGSDGGKKLEKALSPFIDALSGKNISSSLHSNGEEALKRTLRNRERLLAEFNKNIQSYRKIFDKMDDAQIISALTRQLDEGRLSLSVKKVLLEGAKNLVRESELQLSSMAAAQKPKVVKPPIPPPDPIISTSPQNDSSVKASAVKASSSSVSSKATGLILSGAMRELDKAEKAAEKAGKSILAYSHSLRGFNGLLWNTVGAAQAFTAALGFREIVEAINLLQRFENGFRSVTGSLSAGQQRFVEAISMSDKYGLSLKEVSTGMLRFQAASVGTGMSMDVVNEIFDNTSAAITTLGLSSSETEGIFRAFEQIMSKGKIMAEELRLQLGDRLPGAFSIMAEAMGVTNNELDKMLKRGDVTADYLLEFTRVLKQRVASGGGLEAAMQSMRAELERLGNSFLIATGIISEGGFTTAVVEASTSIREFFSSASGASVLDQIGKSVLFLKDALTITIENFSTFALILGAGFLGKKLVAMTEGVSKLSASVFTLKTGVDLLSGAFGQFFKYMLSHPLVAIAAALGSVVIGITLLRGNLSSSEVAIRDLDTATNSLNKATKDYNVLMGDSRKLTEAVNKGVTSGIEVNSDLAESLIKAGHSYAYVAEQAKLAAKAQREQSISAAEQSMSGIRGNLSDVKDRIRSRIGSIYSDIYLGAEPVAIDPPQWAPSISGVMSEMMKAMENTDIEKAQRAIVSIVESLDKLSFPQEVNTRVSSVLELLSEAVQIQKKLNDLGQQTLLTKQSLTFYQQGVEDLKSSFEKLNNTLDSLKNADFQKYLPEASRKTTDELNQLALKLQEAVDKADVNQFKEISSQINALADAARKATLDFKKLKEGISTKDFFEIFDRANSLLASESGTKSSILANAAKTKGASSLQQQILAETGALVDQRDELIRESERLLYLNREKATQLLQTMHENIKKNTLLMLETQAGMTEEAAKKIIQEPAGPNTNKAQQLVDALKTAREKLEIEDKNIKDLLAGIEHDIGKKITDIVDSMPEVQLGRLNESLRYFKELRGSLQNGSEDAKKYDYVIQYLSRSINDIKEGVREFRSEIVTLNAELEPLKLENALRVDKLIADPRQSGRDSSRIEAERSRLLLESKAAVELRELENKLLKTNFEDEKKAILEIVDLKKKSYEEELKLSTYQNMKVEEYAQIISEQKELLQGIGVELALTGQSETVRARITAEMEMQNRLIKLGGSMSEDFESSLISTAGRIAEMAEQLRYVQSMASEVSSSVTSSLKGIMSGQGSIGENITGLFTDLMSKFQEETIFKPIERYLTAVFTDIFGGVTPEQLQAEQLNLAMQSKKLQEEFNEELKKRAEKFEVTTEKLFEIFSRPLQVEVVGTGSPVINQVTTAPTTILNDGEYDRQRLMEVAKEFSSLTTTERDELRGIAEALGPEVLNRFNEAIKSTSESASQTAVAVDKLGAASAVSANGVVGAATGIISALGTITMSSGVGGQPMSMGGLQAGTQDLFRVLNSGSGTELGGWFSDLRSSMTPSWWNNPIFGPATTSSAGGAAFDLGVKAVPGAMSNVQQSPGMFSGMTYGQGIGIASALTSVAGGFLSKGAKPGSARSTAGSVLSGVGSGASMGAMFGPWGAAAGAVIGGIMGFLSSPKPGPKALVNITSHEGRLAMGSSHTKWGGDASEYEKQAQQMVAQYNKILDTYGLVVGKVSTFIGSGSSNWSRTAEQASADALRNVSADVKVFGEYTDIANQALKRFGTSTAEAMAAAGAQIAILKTLTEAIKTWQAGFIVNSPTEQAELTGENWVRENILAGMAKYNASLNPVLESTLPTFGFASGGDVPYGKFWVGEGTGALSGPEVIDYGPEGLHVYSAPQSRQMFGNPGSNLVNRGYASGSNIGSYSAPDWQKYMEAHDSVHGYTNINWNEDIGEWMLPMIEEGKRIFEERARQAELAAKHAKEEAERVRKAQITYLETAAEGLAKTFLPLSSIEQQAAEATGKFKELARGLTDLGHATTAADEGLRKTLETLAGIYNRDVERQIMQIEDPYKASLSELEDERVAALRAAESVGADIARVEYLYGLKRIEIVDQYNSKIVDALNSQMIGDTSVLTPGERINEAQRQYAEAISSRNVDKAVELFNTITGMSKALYEGTTTQVATTGNARAALAGLGKTMGLPGFASGGEFMVKGDNVVPLFRAHDGERVTVTPASRTSNSEGVSKEDIKELVRTNLQVAEEIRSLRKELSAGAQNSEQINRKLVLILNQRAAS